MVQAGLESLENLLGDLLCVVLDPLLDIFLDLLTMLFDITLCLMFRGIAFDVRDVITKHVS